MDSKLIRLKAKLRGYTLEQLATQLNYSRKGFYNLIADDSMPLSLYIKMCDLLQVPFGTFVFNEQKGGKKRPSEKIDRVLDKLDEITYLIQHPSSQGKNSV